MRIARKLALLAMLAIAATALAAPSAFAQTEPELHNQVPRLLIQEEVPAQPDASCPNVVPSPPPAPPALSPNATSGGCVQHYSAPNVVLTAHLTAGGMEIPVSTCNYEFDVRIDSEGEGWIGHQEFTPGTVGTCTRLPCGVVNGEGRQWTMYNQETEVAGQAWRESIVILSCTADIFNPAPAHCEVTIPFTQPSTHRYRWTASNVSGHGAAFPHCEWTGTFDREEDLGITNEFQVEQSVEIRHT